MKRSMHAKRMARRQKRGRSVSKLNLVSLMDIFTILVFFLLVNSSDVEVLQTNKDIKLPQSIADQKPENTLVITVSNDAVIINGRPIVTTAAAMDGEGDQIAPLAEELGYLARRRPFTAEEQQEGRDVTIMGDAAIPYKLLKKIMTTSAQAGYRNISLAVTQMPEETAPAVGG